MFLMVLGKAFKVQVIDREKLISKSKKQILRERKIYPKRGNVYDRNKNPLAINIQTYSLFTIPKETGKNYSNYKKLAKIVPQLTYKKILGKVKGRKNYTFLARKIPLTKDVVAKVKKLKGIYIESVPKRIYPNGEIASQILGFVGVDNNGLAGVEYLFDENLKGKPKVIKYVKDAKGRPIKHTSSEAGRSSQDLHLSIDKDLQAVSEKILKEMIQEYDGEKGGVGVLDVKTGEILAVANYPTFDPNNLRSGNSSSRKLAFATDPFEPGSTMKTFTVASAFENKIATEDTSYYCERGMFKVEDHIISEAESKKDFEWLSVEEILQYSSNIGTTKIAFDLKYPKLKETLLDFGFGSKTGIEVPSESRGILTKKENVSPLSLSNISFGQGVATTGVQMLAAYAAIANSGKYLPPTLIKDGNKDVEAKQIISEKTALRLEKILIKAVEEGTGSKAKLKYFQMAGKTSTAQRVDKGGGYKGYVAGFLGYPVNVKNRFVVYAYVDNPKPLYYGNIVAAPIVAKVSQYLLYKNKDFTGLALSKADQKATIDVVKTSQSSTRNFGPGMTPNFLKLDKSSAKRLAKKLNLQVVQRGIGVVSEQFPTPGTPVPDDKQVVLKYTPPTYE